MIFIKVKVYTVYTLMNGIYRSALAIAKQKYGGDPVKILNSAFLQAVAKTKPLI